jgi:competence protein ComEC
LKWTLLFVSVLGWSCWLESYHFIFIILPVGVGVWFYLKEPAMMPWWGGLAFGFTLIVVIQLTSTFNEEGLFFVREKRATWMIVEQNFHQYYVALKPNDNVEMGDILKITGVLEELRMNTYESMFNFKDYLHDRGVDQTIMMRSFETIVRFPVRFSSIIHYRIDFLEANLRDVVSQWLWNRRHPESNLSAALEQVLGVSGLGFFFLWRTSQKMGEWFAQTHHVKGILLMLFFPYVLMNLHQFGIIRVYLISLTQVVLKKSSIHESKIIVLSFLSWLNPYLWIQPGGQLYLIYQAMLGLIKPMFYRMPSYQQWFMMVAIALGWSWINEGHMSITQSLLYAPLTMIQMLLVPGWMMYLYTGLLLPGLSQITVIVVRGFQLIPMIPNLYLGSIPWYTFLIMTMIVLSLSWVYTMKLTIYVQRLLLTFLIVLVMHISWMDRFFIHEIHFINVGQGDATLVLSQGKTLLIDTGGVLRFDISKEVLIPYFKKLRIRQLDAVMITHDDFDHNGGLPSLIESFRVSRVINQPFDRFQLGRWTITNYQYFLDVLVEDNERSLIIGIANQTCQWLVMGDATTKTEEYLMNFFPHLQATFLRIGHHGSLTSTSSSFLDQIQPREAIISNGGANLYGHPHSEVLERLRERNIRIRRTDQEGTIRYQTCKIEV